MNFYFETTDSCSTRDRVASRHRDVAIDTGEFYFGNRFIVYFSTRVL